MTGRARAHPKKVERIFGIYVSAIGVELVETTPRLTGLARGNWIPTLGAPASFSTLQTDYPGVLTPSKIALLALRWKIGQTFHITNNLIYVAEDLIEGSSPQAPKDFHIQAINVGIIKARRQIDRIIED